MTSNRISKIKTSYKKILSENSITGNAVDTLFGKLEKADCSRGKYVEFLLNCYLQGTIQDEDLEGGQEGPAGRTVFLFHSNKHRLPVEERSLNKYSCLGELWEKVRQYENTMSGKEVKELDKKEALEGTEFIINDRETGFKIIHLLTEKASIFWGKGTRWCTAALKHNAFNLYNKWGNIYVIVLPDGRKFQYFSPIIKREEIPSINFKNSFLANDSDIELNKEFIKEYWIFFSKILLLFDDIKYIPVEFLTQELCSSAYKKNALSLRYFSKEFITEDIMYDVVFNRDELRFAYCSYRSRLDALRYISHSFIEKNFNDLIKNEDFMCVKSRLIPSSLYKEEIREYLMNSIFKKGKTYFIHGLPNEWKDSSFYKRMEESEFFPRLIPFFPLEEITLERVIKAIKIRKSVGYNFNRRLDWKNTVKKLIDYDPSLIRYIHRKHMSENMVKKALVHDINTVFYVKLRMVKKETVKKIFHEKFQELNEEQKVSFLRKLKNDNKTITRNKMKILFGDNIII